MKDVRDTVSQAYTNALSKSQDKPKNSCCGYSGGEEKSYSEASQSSFGCGNPLAFTDVQPGQTVVDLGSGAGLDLLLAADKVGPDGLVIGVDMTDAMLDAARANVEKAGKRNVELRKGFIEELPVEAGAAHWVISNCVINLSPDKDKVFAEIARVLAPGGRFSISDIMVEELPDWIRSHPAAYAACVAGAIPEHEYLEGLRRVGLVDVEVLDRLVYDAAQLRAMVASDLDNLGLDDKVLEGALETVVGKVWSAKIVGRRAA